MTSNIFALASGGSYTVVTTHRAGEIAIVFGDPNALLSLDPQALQRLGYQGHLVGETPEPCAWAEPCASSIYLVKDRHGAGAWLESCSVLGPDGELVVNTRPVSAPTQLLTQTARLSMGGTYLGPISHELNNIVQGVSAAVYLFRDSLSQGDPIDSEDLDQLSDSAGDLANLATELQGFARVGPADPERLDLGVVIHRAVGLLRAVGRIKNLELTQQVPQNLPPMHWRRFEIEAVLLALLGNAGDAALDNGSLPTLGIAVTPLDGAMQIDITGSGGDFDMPRWQVPYRSSKAKSLGLGLSVALAILATRGGRLEKSPQGAGALLRLVLPLHT